MTDMRRSKGAKLDWYLSRTRQAVPKQYNRGPIRVGRTETIQHFKHQTHPIALIFFRSFCGTVAEQHFI